MRETYTSSYSTVKVTSTAQHAHQIVESGSSELLCSLADAVQGAEIMINHQAAVQEQRSWVLKDAAEIGASLMKKRFSASRLLTVVSVWAAACAAAWRRSLRSHFAS